METRRWTNPSQPQTLYVASILLYIQAAFTLLFGNPFGLIGMVLIAGGSVAGAFGIANDRRWGYMLAVGVAVLELVPFAIAIAVDIGSLFSPTLLISAVFPVALFALLVHPMSREYQRVWFH